MSIEFTYHLSIPNSQSSCDSQFDKNGGAL